MISEYRRGWEDALDVVLELRDWEKIETIRDRMATKRKRRLQYGPL